MRKKNIPLQRKEKNQDPRGLLNTNSIDCNIFINLTVLSAIKIQPKLAISESERLQNLDYLDCKYVDFLMFTEYMITPRIFKTYLERKNKNFVNEINIQLGLRKLNLFADISSRKIIFQMSHFVKIFDYENIITMYY